MGEMNKNNLPKTLVGELKKSIRDVPDFPKAGIIFKDITTLIKDPIKFKTAVNVFWQRYKYKKIDLVVAVEARGFIFGGVLAYLLGAGFVPVRKKGKLPADTKEVSYQLEYGRDTLEIHRDAIHSGEKVLLLDDLLATGGTATAVAELITESGADLVEIAFLIELTFLNGRKKLKNYPVFSVIKY
jgi:adenine phosphoribosyltransferase